MPAPVQAPAAAAAAGGAAPARPGAASPGPSLAGLQPAGRGRLTVWGFQVYDAALWVAPGFEPAAFERHAFVLELAYLRDLDGADIARVSLEQMRRHAPIAAAQAERWQAQLAALLPDVRRGDRLAGQHRPGQGLALFHNGRALGELADAQLARLFFAIWLGEASSEPRLREQLLGLRAP